MSENDRKKIEEAIKRAEEITSAEIFAVLTRQSDDYRFVGYSFLGFWIFLCSMLLGFWLGFRNISVDLDLFLAAQVATLITGIALLRFFPNIAPLITPKRVTDERAHNNAVKQFLAHGIDKTKGRTGLLIFVSLDERYAEIIVDSEIESKLGRQFITQCVARLIGECRSGRITDGFILAISDLSEELARVLPPKKNNLNELEDKLIIL